MIQFPLYKEDLTKYEIRPFPERPEVLINNFEMVVRRLISDLQHNMIDTKSKKNYEISIKGNTKTIAYRPEDAIKGVPVVHLRGPFRHKLWRETTDKWAHHTDPVTGNVRIYFSRTAYRLYFEVLVGAVDLENAISDFSQLSHVYNRLHVDDWDSIRVWQDPEVGWSFEPTDFTDFRIATGWLHLEPVYLWDVYNYYETEPITKAILNMYHRGFEEEDDFMISMEKDKEEEDWNILTGIKY